MIKMHVPKFYFKLTNNIHSNIACKMKHGKPIQWISSNSTRKCTIVFSCHIEDKQRHQILVGNPVKAKSVCISTWTLLSNRKVSYPSNETKALKFENLFMLYGGILITEVLLRQAFPWQLWSLTVILPWQKSVLSWHYRRIKPQDVDASITW